MKEHFYCYFSLLCLFVLLSACIPNSFAPPKEIHINSGDQVKQAVTAMDAAGRSHIAGVVNDRIVYYRTTFGEPEVKLTMTMGGAGVNWKQYSPDIAVTNNGTAWLVWIEQRGYSEKYACYQMLTLIPPTEGYDTGCHQLDSFAYTTGKVMVVANGGKAYALYDRVAPDSLIGSLWYKDLTSPSNSLIAYSFIDNSETGVLYSWDAGIDSQGYLHVAFLYNDSVGVPTSTNHLKYRSNRATDLDGTMMQGWSIADSNMLETDTPISLDFYMNIAVETIAVAWVYESIGVDVISVESCPTAGCGIKGSEIVTLPPAWEIVSIISDVEIIGIGTYLYLGFIGDNNPDADAQVYFVSDIYGTGALAAISQDRPTSKFDLEAAKVDSRPESGYSISFMALSW